MFSFCSLCCSLVCLGRIFLNRKKKFFFAIFTSGVAVPPQFACGVCCACSVTAAATAAATVCRHVGRHSTREHSTTQHDMERNEFWLSISSYSNSSKGMNRAGACTVSFFFLFRAATTQVKGKKTFSLPFQNFVLRSSFYFGVEAWFRVAATFNRNNL